jgi:hypothetical protein
LKALTSAFNANAIEQLHTQYLELVPRIEQHANIFFRGIPCAHKRADKVAECLALGWKWFLSVQEKGKDISTFTMVFVYLVAKAVKSGRKLTGMEKAKDVMSQQAQARNSFTVESLPASNQRSHDNLYGTSDGQRLQDIWEERLQDDLQTPIPDQVAFRLDWPRFIATLTQRDRELAEFLSLGHRAKQAADRFKLTPGRVTQLRQQWCREWQIFQDAEVV